MSLGECGGAHMEIINYLQKYEGLQFLNEFYDVEHTLPLADTLESLQKICARNGGSL